MAFIGVFSATIIILFYALISSNGLILGNDPAVHLTKAQVFLATGKISLNNIGWIPPMFEILLAMAISFSGASSVGQLILVEKILAVVIDWLLFISVYLIACKFFNKKVGAVAAVFLSLCYPMYELNTWGGYTTALGIAFLLLLYYYSYLAAKQFGYMLITFFLAFAIFLSHQVTAFIAVLTVLPVMFVMLVRLKGAYLKAFVMITVGGLIAFFAFYFPAIAGYLDTAVYHLFFGNKAYVVDIPFTNFQSFLLYFGLLQFLAIGGIGTGYFFLKRQKKLILFVILLLSLFVPLFFAESYYFGFLLPFEWFTYYLEPPIVILAAVFVVSMLEKFSGYFTKNASGLHKIRSRILVLSLIVLMCLVLVFQSDTVYGKVMQASVFNSTSEIRAYDAGLWLNQNYPGFGTAVVTENPGNWFSIFSGKNVIAQTSGWYGTNDVAESVLGLDYEFSNPQTLVKAYEANGNITDENYVQIDQLWYRVSSSSTAGDFISFNQNGTNHNFPLSSLCREVSFDYQSYPKKIEFKYFDDYVELTQTIALQNDSYPINISWSLSSLDTKLSNVTFYLTTFFDLQFHFDKAQLQPLMNWVNPWDVQSKSAPGPDWAVVNFFRSDLINHYIGLYDDQKQVAFAFNFTDLPEWGNIGALANRQIDAVRLQYQFGEININQTVTVQYQILALAKNSFQTLQPDSLQSLFEFKPAQFSVSTSDYKDYIAENNIQFVVYDKNQYDAQTSSPLASTFLPELAQCKFLELIYSNSRYEVFKILSNFTQTQVWN